MQKYMWVVDEICHAETTFAVASERFWLSPTEKFFSLLDENCVRCLNNKVLDQSLKDSENGKSVINTNGCRNCMQIIPDYIKAFLQIKWYKRRVVVVGNPA